MGVDLSLFAFGNGCNRRKEKGKEDRYYVDVTYTCKGKRFVIQYCKDIQQYVVWENHKDLHRAIYSVMAESVPVIKESRVDTFQKGKEFWWKNIENVYTFKKTGIKEFAKRMNLCKKSRGAE